jgi:hypothetical protein
MMLMRLRLTARAISQMISRFDSIGGKREHVDQPVIFGAGRAVD